MSDIFKKNKLLNGFVKISKGSKPESIGLEDLQQHILGIVLNPKVPVEVNKVFQAAKDLYLFGYFKYYFFTISNHYALLSLESALRNKHKEVFGELNRLVPFPKIIKNLVDKEIINKNDEFIYDISRKLRNYFSHLTSPPTITPPMCLSTLERVKECINKLYLA